MDRIVDSGSTDMGSNPFGNTYKPFSENWRAFFIVNFKFNSQLRTIRRIFQVKQDRIAVATTISKLCDYVQHNRPLTDSKAIKRAN